jgi:hypothetical protein
LLPGHTNQKSRGRKDAMSMIPFDDRESFIWYDGRLVPRHDANLHVLTHLHFPTILAPNSSIA